MIQNQNPGELRFLRRPQVEQKVGLSRSAIYERLDPDSRYYDPSFPKPVALGSGKNPPVAWVESEVDAWIRERIASRKVA